RALGDDDDVEVGEELADLVGQRVDDLIARGAEGRGVEGGDLGVEVGDRGDVAGGVVREAAAQVHAVEVQVDDHRRAVGVQGRAARAELAGRRGHLHHVVAQVHARLRGVDDQLLAFATGGEQAAGEQAERGQG